MKIKYREKIDSTLRSLLLRKITKLIVSGAGLFKDETY